MAEIPNLVDLVSAGPGLPAGRLRQLRRDLSHLVTEIDYRLSEAAPQAPAEPDRAVPLDEACRILGTSKGWLERQVNWRRAGGFKGPDGRVKFRLSALERHVRRGGA